MTRKILLICGAIFLFFQSFKLVTKILPLEIEALWINIIIAIALNLFITGVFALSGFALPTQNLLPDSYYRVKNRKQLKKWYKLLNVNLFRKFLLATVWRNKEQHSKFFDGTRKGIKNLIVQSKKSEFGHIFPFIILSVLSFYLAYLGKWKLMIPTMIMNIWFNFYPVVLQRFHRMRIQVLEARYKSKS